MNRYPNSAFFGDIHARVNFRKFDLSRLKVFGSKDKVEASTSCISFRKQFWPITHKTFSIIFVPAIRG